MKLGHAVFEIPVYVRADRQTKGIAHRDKTNTLISIICTSAGDKMKITKLCSEQTGTG